MVTLTPISRQMAREDTSWFTYSRGGSLTPELALEAGAMSLRQGRARIGVTRGVHGHDRRVWATHPAITHLKKIESASLAYDSMMVP